MQINELNEQEIQNILEKILNRREFHSGEQRNPIIEVIGGIWEAIKDWIKQVLQYRQPEREIQINPNLYNSTLQNVLRVLLILITVSLLFLLVRLLIKRVYLPIKIKANHVPKVYDYLDKPEQAIKKYNEYMSLKEYSKALRFLFVALLLEFDRRKIIRIEKWKTNRMYIREIGMIDKELIFPMQQFSALFNACCYGNRTIDEISVTTWFNFYISQKEKPL